MQPLVEYLVPNTSVHSREMHAGNSHTIVMRTRCCCSCKKAKSVAPFHSQHITHNFSEALHKRAHTQRLKRTRRTARFIRQKDGRARTSNSSLQGLAHRVCVWGGGRKESWRVVVLGLCPVIPAEINRCRVTMNVCRSRVKKQFRRPLWQIVH